MCCAYTSLPKLFACSQPRVTTMSARRPPSVSKKQRLSSAPPAAAAPPRTLPLPLPPFPSFSSPPATHTCYAAPPILFFPKPTPAPLRPASSRPSRSSLHTSRSAASTPSVPSSIASSARPATARAAASERKGGPGTSFAVSDFHVSVTYRPASPRSSQLSAWTTAASPPSYHSSPSCHTASSARVDDEDADADSCSTEEEQQQYSFISPFFLAHDPIAAQCPRPPHPTSSSHSVYRTVATLPSHDRHKHRQRFLSDNAFEHSFSRIIGGSSSPSTTATTAGRQYGHSADVYGETRRLYEASGVSGEGRAHLPGGTEHLLGKWKPLTRNGNELFANVVSNSKFHQPTFVCAR